MLRVRRESEVARVLARPVWVVPREVFDTRLVARATATGAVLRQGRATAVRREAGAVEVAIAGAIPVTARVVVAADGAHSAARAGRDQARLPLARPSAATPSTPPGRRGQQVIAYGGGRAAGLRLGVLRRRAVQLGAGTASCCTPRGRRQNLAPLKAGGPGRAADASAGWDIDPSNTGDVPPATRPDGRHCKLFAHPQRQRFQAT